MPYKDKEKAKAATRDYYRRNSEKVIARTTAYQKKQSAEKKREWHLRHKYGLEMSEFNVMLKNQQARCAICDEEKDLKVDHCHSHGNVRGLLCFECNIGLGMFKDNTDYLEKAIEYLENGITGKGGSCGI